MLFFHLSLPTPKVVKKITIYNHGGTPMLAFSINLPIKNQDPFIPLRIKMMREDGTVYYGGGGGVGRLTAAERRVRVGEVALRCLICGLGALAAALVGFDTEVKQIFGIEREAKFTDMKALVFLVVADGVAAGYSLLQGLRCVVAMVRGSVLLSKPLAWLIFSLDQVMAYVTLAAVAAATQSAVLGEFGQPELQWLKICNLYGKFCTRVGEGLLSGFLVSLSMITLSCISAFNLFRLCGSGKKKIMGS